MLLELSHTKPDVFNKMSKSFVLSCYKETKALPPEEKFGIIQQIRKAALSGHLNIAEGCSGKSAAERRRYYEVARGSLIEVDTG
jgi:four helix bundle protein